MNKSMIQVRTLDSPLDDVIRENYFKESNTSCSFGEPINETYLQISNQERHIQNLREEQKELEAKYERLNRDNIDLKQRLKESEEKCSKTERQLSEFIRLVSSYLDIVNPAVKDTNDTHKIPWKDEYTMIHTRLTSLLYQSLRRGIAFPFSNTLARMQSHSPFYHSSNKAQSDKDTQ